MMLLSPDTNVEDRTYVPVIIEPLNLAVVIGKTHDFEHLVSED